jgi:hypothetical protein
MGSARILREYIGLEQTFPIPLSISHGVDMGHCMSAMDVHSAPPIHWSCNQSVHERAQSVKPSLRIPHPWMMLKAGRSVRPGSGTLVIGPPPSKHNDSALLNGLKQAGIDTYDLLIKFRGTVDPSFAFWEGNGVKVVSAGLRDDYFYDRLFDLLECYEYVIGCTLSSALIFAAAIGRKCEVIGGFEYKAYESPNYVSMVNFDSPVVRQFAHLLSLANHKAVSNMALAFLGHDLLGNRTAHKEELISAIEDLKMPVHFSAASWAIERSAVLMISKWLGKTGLIEHGIFHYLLRRVSRKVSLIKIDELGIWLNGLNEHNFQIEQVGYISDVTEPGWGAD